MNLRQIVLLTASGLLTLSGGCSRGIGNNLPTPDAAPVQSSPNRPVGLDLGVAPDDALAEQAVAGVVVPPIGSNPAREVVLLAFTTESDAADANGDANSTDPISRQGETDGNGARDVFVAAVCAQDIDDNAFSQSLAGKFRHPRCTTCHSMQASDSLAFATAGMHPGGNPGADFPVLSPEQCTGCHSGATNDPVPGWQAPDATFDLRTKTVQQLADAAKIAPTGDPEHFIGDGRVLWALDSGILPRVGGGNGIADDDHDGVDEPTDTDGVIRTVPGGSAAFIAQIEAWEAAGNPVTSAGAVKDVILVSRQNGASAAGNGASSRPALLFVPNGSFDPAAGGTIGTLYVAYESLASNLAASTDGNGASDVYLTTVTLQANVAGDLSLAFGTTTLVSQNASGSDAGNGASTAPSIGGPSGDLVAFQSLANDLVTGFTDNNGAGADVYVRVIGGGMKLISHQEGDANIGGNGSSEAPALDPTGTAVAFESDASDLLATPDANGVRDVFYADASGAAPFARVRASVTSVGGEGSGGPSGDASIHYSGTRALVVFESDKTDLAPVQSATSNVFLFDSTSGTTTLLNQLQSATASAIGDGAARNPVIGADGRVVAFESDADNIDVLRADGNPTTDVFLVETSQALSGVILPYRFSLTTVEAADADGPSTNPAFGTFADASDNFGVGFATYQTAAKNLGTSDTTNLVVNFLDETSGVVANFSGTPTSGVLPVTVQFTDSSSGTPTSWQWDFDNDGNIDSTEQNPSFTYTQPGDYTVVLTAANARAEDTISKAAFVSVSPPPVTASFTPTGPLAIAAGDSVQFDASATVGAAAYAWNFGDGETGDGVVATHTFASGGAFTVTLTATGPFGNSDTATAMVSVAGDVTATFTLSATSGYSTDSLTLDASGTSGSGAPFTYAWDLDDDGLFDDATGAAPTITVGDWFTLPNATTEYSANTIRMRATDSGGGTGVATGTFTRVADSIEATPITPVKDTTIYQLWPNQCNPANVETAAGRAYASPTAYGPRRALMEFDVAGSITSGATILAVDLQLQCTRAPDTNSRTFSVHTLDTEWGEVGTDPGGVIGGGATGVSIPNAVAGDATWNSPTFGTGSWTGGSFGAARRSITVNGTGTYNWTSSLGANPGMTADVQAWMDPAQNHGWILLGPEGAVNAPQARAFGARENLTPANRPQLTITYRPPLL